MWCCNLACAVYQIINSLAYRGFYGGALYAVRKKAALIKLTSIGYVQFLLEEFVMRAEGISGSGVHSALHQQKSGSG